MKTMHLFRISYQDLGEEIELNPDIPQFRLPEEDNQIPRVCAALTILQCIQSKASFLSSKLWTDDYYSFYVYEADIPVEDLLQPTLNQVEDVWFTGELWVIKPHIWKKTGKYAIELGERIYAKDYMNKYYIHEESVPSFNNNDQPKYAIDGKYNSFFFVESGPDRYYLKAKENLKKGNK